MTSPKQMSSGGDHKAPAMEGALGTSPDEFDHSASMQQGGTELTGDGGVPLLTNPGSGLSAGTQQSEDLLEASANADLSAPGITPLTAQPCEAVGQPDSKVHAQHASGVASSNESVPKEKDLEKDDDKEITGDNTRTGFECKSTSTEPDISGVPCTGDENAPISTSNVNQTSSGFPKAGVYSIIGDRRFHEGDRNGDHGAADLGPFVHSLNYLIPESSLSKIPSSIFKPQAEENPSGTTGSASVNQGPARRLQAADGSWLVTAYCECSATGNSIKQMDASYIRCHIIMKLMYPGDYPTQKKASAIHTSHFGFLFRNHPPPTRSECTNMDEFSDCLDHELEEEIQLRDSQVEADKRGNAPPYDLSLQTLNRDAEDAMHERGEEAFDEFFNNQAILEENELAIATLAAEAQQASAPATEDDDTNPAPQEGPAPN